MILSMTRRKSASIGTLVLTASLMTGCLTEEAGRNPEPRTALAASVAAAGMGPVQKFIFVPWGDNKNSYLSISKLAWGWNGYPCVVASGNIDGTNRTNGLFFRQNDGIWSTISKNSMTNAKTAFAVDPPTSADKSVWFAAKGDGWIYKSNGYSETGMYRPFKDVAVGNDMAAGNTADMWVIGQLDNYVYHRSGGSFLRTTMKAKRIAAGGNGVPWAINMSDQACYLPKGTTTWKCPAGPKASAVAAGTDNAASAWMLGTVPVAPYKDFSIYKFEGGEWIRCNGAATQIAVDNNGKPWILNASGQLFTGTPGPVTPDPIGNGTWTLFSGTLATEIGAGGSNNTVWTAGIDIQPNGGKIIYKLSGTTGQPTKGTGFNVDIGSSGLAWLVGADKRIWSSPDGTNWSIRGSGSQTFSDVGAGLSGSIWAIGTDAFDTQGNFALYRWHEGVWVRNTWMGGVRVDVDPKGRPWVVTAAGDVFECAENEGLGYWFLRFGPRAKDIGIGGSTTDPFVWIIGDLKVQGTEDYAVYRMRHFIDADKWTLFPGGGVRITATNDGTPWIRNSAYQVWVGGR